MTAPNLNNEPTSDLHDRLLDRALTEVIANDTPPDLSANILAAHSDSLKVNSSMSTTPFRRRRFVSLTMTCGR
jgi:hypothetical protein